MTTSPVFIDVDLGVVDVLLVLLFDFVEVDLYDGWAILTTLRVISKSQPPAIVFEWLWLND